MAVKYIETKREPMGSKIAKWLVRQGLKQFRVFNHEPSDRRDACFWDIQNYFGTVWQWNSQRNGVTYRKLTRKHGESRYDEAEIGLLCADSDVKLTGNSIKVCFVIMGGTEPTFYRRFDALDDKPTRFMKFVEAYGMKCVKVSPIAYVVYG